MTLILEDGTGVQDADTFVTAAQHVAYCLLYGEVKTEEQAEIDMRSAMDYIQSKKYKGCKTYATSINYLLFPRKNLYVDRVLLASDQVPVGVIKSQNEIGRSISAGVDPLGIQERVTKEEKFDAFDVVYMDNQAIAAQNPRIDLFLEPFLLFDGGGLHFKVITDRERCLNNSLNNGGYLGEDGYWVFDSTYNGPFGNDI